MGEIKSTLDLVMERTRHLSLSSQERVQQQQAAALASAQERVLARLAGVHGIRGSAVIANPEKDPACVKDLYDLRQRTLARIDVIAGQAA